MATVAAPVLERYQASLTDPDQATAETVQVMAKYINTSAGDPLYKRISRECVWRFGGGVSGGCPIGRRNILRFDAGDPRICAIADFWWSKHYIKFVHHEEMLLKWLNEADQLQLLISPDALVRMVRPQGDCAIYTMAICALLRCQGIPFEIVTVAVSRNRPQEFSHVFPRAILPNGQRLTLDAGRSGNANMWPGWEIPRQARYRTQVWDESARPVEDVSQWAGLHGYVNRRGGFGDFTDPNTGVTISSPTTDVSGMSPDQIAGLINAGASQGDIFTPPALPPTNIPQPAAGSTNWGNVLANLLGQGVNLAGKVVAPTTTVQRGPNGQVLIQTPASSGASAGTSILATAGGVGLTGNTLLWIGGGIALILALKAFGNR